MVMFIMLLLLASFAKAEVTSPTFSMDVAARAVRFARAAYYNANGADSSGLTNEEVGDFLRSIHPSEIVRFGTDLQDTNSASGGFVAIDRSRGAWGPVIVIVYRGTRSDLSAIRSDWLKTNVKAEMVQINVSTQHGPVNVHSGFLWAFLSTGHAVWEAVRAFKERPDIADNVPILITGHSLGAAQATLCAHQLHVHVESPRGQSPISLYSFGSPRVGNLGFAKQLMAAVQNRHYRVHNPKDVVPQFPPGEIDNIIKGVKKGAIIGMLVVACTKFATGGVGLGFAAGAVITGALAGAAVTIVTDSDSNDSHYMHAGRQVLLSVEHLVVARTCEWRAHDPSFVDPECQMTPTAFVMTMMARASVVVGRALKGLVSEHTVTLYRRAMVNMIVPLYSGEYALDSMHGQGVLRLTDGSSFSGQWNQGRPVYDSDKMHLVTWVQQGGIHAATFGDLARAREHQLRHQTRGSVLIAAPFNVFIQGTQATARRALAFISQLAHINMLVELPAEVRLMNSSVSTMNFIVTRVINDLRRHDIVRVCSSSSSKECIAADSDGSLHVRRCLDATNGCLLSLNFLSSGRYAIQAAGSNAPLANEVVALERVPSKGEQTVLMKPRGWFFDIEAHLHLLNARWTVGGNGETALIRAIIDKDIDFVRQLLKFDGLKLNLLDNAGRTALMHAVIADREAFSSNDFGEELLKQERLDVNAVDKDGNTALMYAITSRRGFMKSLAFITQLIQLPRLDVNTVNDNGKTALIMAACRNDITAVKLLLQRTKINITIRDRDGKAARCWAKEKGHSEIVALVDARVRLTTPASVSEWVVGYTGGSYSTVMLQRFPNENQARAFFRSWTCSVSAVLFFSNHVVEHAGLLNHRRRIDLITRAFEASIHQDCPNCPKTTYT